MLLMLAPILFFAVAAPSISQERDATTAVAVAIGVVQRAIHGRAELIRSFVPNVALRHAMRD